MAKVNLGTKRACLACGMRFYDFKRSPIICPGCGATFDPENISKSRKGRSLNKTTSVTSKIVTDGNLSENMEPKGLSETIIADKDDNDIVDDEELDFDEGDDEGDDDGPGIIQDDISDDDELLPNLDDKEDI